MKQKPKAKTKAKPITTVKQLANAKKMKYGSGEVFKTKKAKDNYVAKLQKAVDWRASQKANKKKAPVKKK